METLDRKIVEYSKMAEKKMLEIRRDIHQHPELGNCEYRTADLIVNRLRELGVDEIYTGLAGSTGVLGIIYGTTEGSTKGLRADMDALPVKEKTQLPFASTDVMKWGDQGQVPVMHACGHDCHVAMLLAATEVIVKLKAYLKGKVALIFQPAEEGKASDWNQKSGAEAYIADSVFQQHVSLDSVLCLHVAPHLPVGSAGKITFHKGVGGYYMYITRIVIKGKGGHANRYWETSDPIAAAAQVIVSVQNMVSKKTNPNTNQASFSIGMVSGGTKFNVIPDEAIIEGALRVTDKDVQKQMWDQVCDTIHHIAGAFGCKAEISCVFCPAIYNDPAFAESLENMWVPILGQEYVSSIGDNNGMDDFSHFQMHTPGVWARLSVAADSDIGANLLHSATMTVNERGLLNGVVALSAFTLKHP